MTPVFRIITQENCNPCAEAKALIHAAGFAYEEVKFVDFPEAEQTLFKQEWKTLPQIFFGGMRIGGRDHLVKFLADPKTALLITPPITYPPLQVKRLSPTARLPERGSAEAIGVDLFANLGLGETKTIHRDEVCTIKTGVAMKPPPGHYLRVAPRSGLAVKSGVDILAGVIDRDYTGEIIVVMSTDGPAAVTIKHGDKIAQVIAERATILDIIEVVTLDETARGANGFGSTG